MRKLNSVSQWSRLVFVSGLLLVPSLFLAQTGAGTFGTILGAITDETGAVVPRVAVTVLNEKTGVSRHVSTNSTGDYQVPALLPGTYSITAEASGFKKYIRSGVILPVNESVRIEIKLQVGQVSDTVEVQGAAPALDTTSGTVASVVDNKTVVELPLNKRDFSQLTYLIPGATQGNNQGGFFYIGGGNVSVAGNRSEDNNYTLDGVDDNENLFKFQALKPSIDAIDEFKIQTNITSAQFGVASGANVNVATKAGTNQFHAVLFEFLRNNVLDGKQFNDVTTLPYRFNDYGATLSGPVIIPGVYHGRDRTFWMFNYEATRTRQTNTSLAVVPTAAMLGGDLSHDAWGNPAPQIFDPTTTSCSNNVCTRQPFQNNQIPTSDFNQFTLINSNAVYSKLVPNILDATEGNPNFRDTEPYQLNTAEYTTRIDHHFSDKDSVFGRYSQSRLDELSPLGLPGIFQDRFNYFYNVGVNYTHMFNPTSIFTMAYGYNSNQLGFFGPDLGVVPKLLSAGFTGIPATFAGHEYVVSFSPSGISTPGEFTFSNGPDHNHEFLPNLLMIRGKHTINLGGEIKYEHIFHDGQNSAFGFDPTATNDGSVGATDGQSWASYLLGLPSSSTRLEGKASLIAHRYLFHFYGQDDIKVTKKLTLNLGLRYEDSQWYTADSGAGLGGYNVQTSSYAWASTNPITNQAANVPATWAKPQPILFAPRFGFAYLITPKTTVRGGYGIFYNSDYAWEWTEMRGNYPFAISQQFVALNSPGASVTPVQSVYSASFDPGSILPPPVFSTMDTNLKHGYSQQWNLMIEREIAKDFILDVGYMGNKSTHLTGTVTINTAPPGPGAINPRRPLQNLCAGAGTDAYTCQSFNDGVSDGNSDYNALTIRADKRFTKNVSFLANYAYSNCFDTYSSFPVTFVPQNPADIGANRGHCDIYSKHVLSAGYVTQLPFGRGQPLLGTINGITDKLVGGWQVDGFITYRSGTPFNVVLNEDVANTGVGNELPNLVGNPYPAGTRTQQEWFDPNSLASPAPYTFGNLGRNVLIGPAYQTWDIGIFKNFQVREVMRIQFRAEAFNAFNQTNLGSPNNVLDTSGQNTTGLGQIHSAAGVAREIQFGLKLYF